MHICFVTYQGEPGFTADDKLLALYLEKRGISVSPAVWDDGNVDWTQFDAIVLRSTWDYHKKFDEFNIWLDQLSALKCRVLNPIPVIRWNQNKRYLLDLDRQGKYIPPFVFCDRGSKLTLAKILRSNNWLKAVIKPAVSGGAFNTWVSSADVEDEEQFEQMLIDGDVIVQKFMDEIVDHGELSLMFFNKVFSHAILKKTGQGDFRVQTQFGGTSKEIFPDKEIIQYAASLLDDIHEPLLFARVDGLLVDDQFYLMELELIEPALFMAKSEHACENFYRASTDLMAQP